MKKILALIILSSYALNASNYLTSGSIHVSPLAIHSSLTHNEKIAKEFAEDEEAVAKKAPILIKSLKTKEEADIAYEFLGEELDESCGRKCIPRHSKINKDKIANFIYFLNNTIKLLDHERKGNEPGYFKGLLIMQMLSLLKKHDVPPAIDDSETFSKISRLFD